MQGIGATGSHHLSNPQPTTSAMPLVPARRGGSDGGVRLGLIIQNQGPVDVYLGPSTVVAGPTNAASRGILLKGGQTPPACFTDTASGDSWYGITASGTADLCVDEVY
jgi:hypothetical protein